MRVIWLSQISCWFGGFLHLLNVTWLQGWGRGGRRWAASSLFAGRWNFQAVGVCWTVSPTALSQSPVLWKIFKSHLYKLPGYRACRKIITCLHYSWIEKKTPLKLTTHQQAIKKLNKREGEHLPREVQQGSKTPQETLVPGACARWLGYIVVWWCCCFADMMFMVILRCLTHTN